eukprot:CAMPEP_0205943606 /NCGR_PEP_ID=MMETSP1325-20131115/60941_1 /ASSEMBLY_ACC=CAM_ASM_000708 /TAXON_ID=236786 /ORGANISM="Florenciella sp., Strain RCC1007" /LENGTH=278 /DNA_ID=CAMNT_0053314437 /DNA_START=1 /DNA_END=833 /DNA_ORIENTATION=+
MQRESSTLSPNVTPGYTPNVTPGYTPNSHSTRSTEVSAASVSHSSRAGFEPAPPLQRAGAAPCCLDPRLAIRATVVAPVVSAEDVFGSYAASRARPYVAYASLLSLALNRIDDCVTLAVRAVSSAKLALTAERGQVLAARAGRRGRAGRKAEAAGASQSEGMPGIGAEEGGGENAGVENAPTSGDGEGAGEGSGVEEAKGEGGAEGGAEGGGGTPDLEPDLDPDRIAAPPRLEEDAPYQYEPPPLFYWPGAPQADPGPPPPTRSVAPELELQRLQRNG